MVPELWNTLDSDCHEMGPVPCNRDYTYQDTCIYTTNPNSAVVANSIDGVSSNVPEHFGSIYSQLYNSADEAYKLQAVYERVKSNSSHVERISKITPDLLKQAADKLKQGKADPVYSFHLTASKMAVLLPLPNLLL